MNRAPRRTFGSDEVAEHALEILLSESALPRRRFTPDWDAFTCLSHKVHERFEIPSTTFTPTMRHLLYLLGEYARPRMIVGAGTYVGYTLAWLIRDAGGIRRKAMPRSIVGLDIDARATEIARRNCAILGHGRRLSLHTEDAVTYLQARSEPIDCLYIDIDSPDSRKDGYVDVLRAALPRMTAGALVLAHDACVDTFAKAFERYHKAVTREHRLRGPWILPVDNCGLSVAAVR